MRPNLTAKCLLCLAALACLAAFGFHVHIGFNNDNTTLMYQTQRMLAGATLYKDLFEVAPPFIHFLYTIPVVAITLTGLPAEIALDSYIGLLMLLSLALSFCIIRKRHNVLNSALLLVPPAIALFIYSFYAEVYADREHLVVILMLPFLFLQSPWFETAALPKSLRFFIGAMAGIGSVLKPYYLIIPLFIWLYRLLCRRGLFCAENIGVAVSWVAFALTLLLLTPHYLYDVLPVALEVYHGSLPEVGKRMIHLRAEYFPYLPFLFGFALLAWRKHFAQVAFLLTLVAAAAVVYCLNSGWYYTVYPLYAVSFMATVYLYLLTPHKKLLFVLVPYWLYFTGLPLVQRIEQQIAVQHRSGHPMNFVTFRPEVKRVFTPYLTPNASVAMYSTETWATNLLQIAPIISASRFDSMWQLPGIVGGNAPFSEAFFFNALTEDLREKKPAVVFIEQSPVMRHLLPSFDILGYFLRDEAFAGEWQHYRLAEKVDVCATANKKVRCAYAVWTRTP